MNERRSKQSLSAVCVNNRYKNIVKKYCYNCAFFQDEVCTKKRVARVCLEKYLKNR